MSKIQIFFIVYAALVVVGLPLIIRGHIKNKNILFEVLATIFMPFVLLIGLVLYIQNWWYKRFYKDKPRPLPKKILKFTYPDCVSVNGTVMSLAEYNIKYDKNLSLKDVYGAKYAKNVNPKDIRTFENYRKLNISEDVANVSNTEYVEKIGNAFLKKDFSEVEPLLSEDASLVIHGEKTIIGAKNIIEYWLDWIERCKNDGVLVLYTIKYCKWFSLPVLQISPEKHADMYEIVKVTNNLITLIEQVPNSNGDLDLDRLEIKDIQALLTDEIEPKPNHIVCLDCGTSSDALKWYRIKTPDGSYDGYISICPHCNKIVEFIPGNRFDFEPYSFFEMEGEEPPL